jgi:hypothetical protein
MPFLRFDAAARPTVSGRARQIEARLTLQTAQPFDYLPTGTLSGIR